MLHWQIFGTSEYLKRPAVDDRDDTATVTWVQPDLTLKAWHYLSDILPILFTWLMLINLIRAGAGRGL